MTNNIETPPHDETIAQIARGLSPEQRAWLAGGEGNRPANINVIWPLFDNGAGQALLCVNETALGAQVRAYLENHP